MIGWRLRRSCDERSGWMKAMAMIALEKHRYQEVHVQARLTATLRSRSSARIFLICDGFITFVIAFAEDFVRASLFTAVASRIGSSSSYSAGPLEGPMSSRPVGSEAAKLLLADLVTELRPSMSTTSGSDIFHTDGVDRPAYEIWCSFRIRSGSVSLAPRSARSSCWKRTERVCVDVLVGGLITKRPLRDELTNLRIQPGSIHISQSAHAATYTHSSTRLTKPACPTAHWRRPGRTVIGVRIAVRSSESVSGGGEGRGGGDGGEGGGEGEGGGGGEGGGFLSFLKSSTSST